mmetsp:Transcript_132986/g.231164  ORF Transcript_132986/g.231164 Transcript_132986/m.231164 type:complete len:195 (+) Transcript_132986:97-681(+)
MADDNEMLYELARRGKLKKVTELLDKGVPPDTFRGYDGSNSLTIAARNGRGEVVELLLARRATLDVHTEDGSPPLMHAVSGKNGLAVAAILSAKADPNENNEDGVSPLILAGEKGDIEVTRILLEARADVNAIAEGWGSALDVAIEERHVELAEFLKSVGAKETSAEDRGDPEERKVTAGEKWGYDAFDSEEDY